MTLGMCMQLCQAHRNQAQKHVIVVMSWRPKRVMDNTHRSIIPEADRLLPTPHMLES